MNICPCCKTSHDSTACPTPETQGVGCDALLGRLVEVSNELCADYPNIENAEPWERLYALEQSWRGIDAANTDLHAIIEKLRTRCGMTKEEVADLGWPNVGEQEPL